MKRGTLRVWDVVYLVLVSAVALSHLWYFGECLVYFFENGYDGINEFALFWMMALGGPMVVGVILPIRKGFLGGPVLLFSLIPLFATWPMIPLGVWGIFLSFRKPALQIEE